MSYNAALTYTDFTGKTLGLGLWLMEYSQSHELAGETSQSKWYQHFYPRSYSPGTISVTGRVRTQQRYDQVIEFIRAHQELMIQKAGASNADSKYSLPLMSFAIPFENVYVDGWIAAIQGGAKRFNPAPEYTFDFFVVKDAHSMNTDLRPASVMRSWWNGSIIDAGEIHNEVTIDQQDGTIYNPYTDPNSQKIG